MCGINGFNFADKKLILAMNQAIKHRGPDDKDISVQQGLSLGQVRLSVIDTSVAGRQPMFYQKGRGAANSKMKKQQISTSKLCIVYNGEIYNYVEVKEELRGQGYTFTTDSDTEVILAAYAAWGFDCVQKLNGMWAFALYDKEKQILFCSRDRLGVKPFYFYQRGKKFIFSSELRGILQHKRLKINRFENISKDAVDLYFSLNYIPAPYSIFKDVFKLEAGHNLIYDLRTSSIRRKYRYYRVPKHRPLKNRERLVKIGRELLQDATRLRMRSDVAVGAFLSGGLDSSAVVGTMREFTDLSKLHTFSIGFKEGYDETPYINIVKNAYKTQHHHHYYRHKSFAEDIRRVAKVFDEPLADQSCYPTRKIAEIAKKHVTVSLSGDGGDEIFGGYNIHLVGARLDLLRRVPKFLRRILARIPAKQNLNSFFNLYTLKSAMQLTMHRKEQFFSKVLEGEVFKPKIYRQWTEQRLKECLRLSDGSMRDTLRLFDLLYNTLPDYFLAKVDRASMAHALEVRSPFLDYRFVDYSQRIPAKYKTSILQTKILMRQIIKGLVPESICQRSKQGFTPPLEEWINSPLYKKELQSGLQRIKHLNPELHTYYMERVFTRKDRLYIRERIKLFFFEQWVQEWVEFGKG